MHFPLWERGDSDNATVHIFGEMDLALRQTPERALEQAVDMAEQVGNFIRRAGANTFEGLGAEGTDTVYRQNIWDAGGVLRRDTSLCVDSIHGTQLDTRGSA